MTGEEIRATLSKNIKFLRNQRNMSQAELAEKSEISVPFLSAIERGTKWPHPDSLAKLGNALGVDVCDIFNSGTQKVTNNPESLSLMKKLIENERKLLDSLYFHYFGKDK